MSQTELSASAHLWSRGRSCAIGRARIDISGRSILNSKNSVHIVGQYRNNSTHLLDRLFAGWNDISDDRLSVCLDATSTQTGIQCLDVMSARYTLLQCDYRSLELSLDVTTERRRFRVESVRWGDVVGIARETFRKASSTVIGVWKVDPGNDDWGQLGCRKSGTCDCVEKKTFVWNTNVGAMNRWGCRTDRQHLSLRMLKTAAMYAARITIVTVLLHVRYDSLLPFHYVHPRMRLGNVYGLVRLCFCLSVCHISRSSSCIKVIGLRSHCSHEQNSASECPVHGVVWCLQLKKQFCLILKIPEFITGFIVAPELC